MKTTFFYAVAGSVAAHMTEAPVFAVRAFERGYFPVFTHATAAQLNETRAPSDAVLESALMASMFGWHVPAAKLAREFCEACEASTIGDICGDRLSDGNLS